jgi:hypothetical protein
MGGLASADPTTIYFTGTTGVCRSVPCNELDVGILPGRPFTGHFSYDAFTAFPNDWGGFAGDVENFVVEFENITFTANEAELRVQPFNGERQFVAVVGEIPGGFMTIGVTSTELPARTDLLNPTGITWDCLLWGVCGFQIRIHDAPFSNYTLQYPTAVSAFYSPVDGSNGSLQFVPAPAALRKTTGKQRGVLKKELLTDKKVGCFCLPPS